MSDEYLKVGEFTRAMDAFERRMTERIHALDGRLSAISRDARDTRDAIVDHKVRIAVIETSTKRARNTTLGTAAATAIALAIEGIRRVITP